MKRVLTTLSAALLVIACEGSKGPELTGDKPPETSGDTSESDSETGPDTSGDPPVVTSAGPTTEGETDTSTTGDTTCSFVCDTTDGNNEEGPQCDNWGQDCPDGQKCAAYANDGGFSWNSTKCVPADPTGGQVGDPCTVEGNGVSGIDSCGFGSMCWDVDPENGQGLCVALCTGTPDAAQCAPTGTTCVVANEGVLNLCLPQCDPLLQNCESGDLCLPNPLDATAFVCILDASGESGTTFDPCEYGNACDAGFVCQEPIFASECDPAAAGCCLPYCDLSEPECPGANQDCLAWFEAGMAPPGYENVGYCGIPQG
ncbi:ribulose phosphate epimerase [Nannocystis radixulma]|uniref:Ribulose phosphate epimerase n=1 Tax=Nannocystis radixulma TaxID=2995305 RepID=A0ABT5B5Z1_9BACT|nr:ribulose phosphate epimerase [Nannocystis radixulma]MDC0669540.1 ribulose phosphate epimerase [Nannocystis radixulma]